MLNLIKGLVFEMKNNLPKKKFAKETKTVLSLCNTLACFAAFIRNKIC